MMTHETWHLIKESFELAWNALQGKSSFWQSQEEKVAISHCFIHADPTERHAVQINPKEYSGLTRKEEMEG